MRSSAKSWFLQAVTLALIASGTASAGDKPVLTVELDKRYTNPTSPDPYADSYFVARTGAAPQDGMDEDWYRRNDIVGGCFTRESEVKMANGTVVGWIYADTC